MTMLLKILVGAYGASFLLVGLGWWIVPEAVSTQFDMMLLSDTGLSTQIGDLASFFLVLGGCMVVALLTGKRVWLLPALSLIAIAMLGRIFAWQFHGASLPLNMIAVEVTGSAVLILAFLRFQKTGPAIGN